MRTAMAFGTFDLLHPGHIYYLKKARELADRLVVVVARDENVLRAKGRKPLHNEKERLAQIQGLEMADEAILGDREMRKWGIIKRFHPTVIALGYDQSIAIPSLQKELKELGLSPEIKRIGSFKPEKYKSSKLRK
ncbi:MAG: FAD synthase [Candidatus Diapherotrites archaeon]|uniref:FAD synthase n=1 Tax=Candidatus Iainarchaeum sp. TaxID=3101447 RepID=A0A939C6T9_9ARCH|nr:FAD synthase [Candidatus Diapherotrites archaeon]